MQLKPSLLAFAFALFSGSSVTADKLDDFKEAASKTGCESIPYSDQRNGCRSQQAYVEEWCKGSRGPTSCKVNVKADLIREQVREYGELDKLTHKQERP